MTTEIGEIIFETNSTLFEVLDRLDIVDLSGQVLRVEDRLDEVNDQLRQLGIIVDANQVQSTTNFIAVNTRIDGLDTQVQALIDEVGGIDVSGLNARVNSLELSVGNIETSLVNMNASINSLINQVGDLRTSVDGQSLELAQINQRVDTRFALRRQDNIAIRNTRIGFSWSISSTANAVVYFNFQNNPIEQPIMRFVTYNVAMSAPPGTNPPPGSFARFSQLNETSTVTGPNSYPIMYGPVRALWCVGGVCSGTGIVGVLFPADFTPQVELKIKENESDERD